MALPVYLAMTAAELEFCDPAPAHCAWMACHFSSYGLGLSNSPHRLPPGSILILNDRTPVLGHDPELIARQLAEGAERLDAAGVLLDFQRPGNPRTEAIVRKIADTLPCPVAVTECYAESASCAVFLDAPRAYHPLSRQAEKWRGRQLWLEASFSPGTVTVTKDGSRYAPECDFPENFPVHTDESLSCHYTIQKQEDRVIFSLRRTAQDLAALLAQAEALGITHAIGLYQELGEAFLKE